MYAVIETGGKQYRVQPGDFIQIEKLEGNPGEKLQFSQVLFCSQPPKTETEPSQLWVGKPYLTGASVQGEVVGQGRGEKVFIVKMKRRKGYRKTQGHRQEQTQVLITALDNGSGQKAGLSTEEAKAKLASFRTSLTPKGGFPKGDSAEESAKQAIKKTVASEDKAPAKKAAAPKKTKKAE